MSAAPAPRLYDPETADAPRHDPRAFRHGSPGTGRPAGPAGSRTAGRPASSPSRKGGGRPPQGPGGGGGSRPSGPVKGASTPSAAPRRLPLAARLALLPIRLALVPLRLAGLVLGRITGGRPWLALVLILGCGVIFLHAATLKTNQLIEQRDAQISQLERSTASLRNSVAELGSTDRVSRVGREAGMVFPDPEGVGYLDARKAKAERAAKAFGPPSATWLPAPNRSSQNGDALNADGSVAEGGLGGTAGAAVAGTAAAGTGYDATGGDATATGGDATATGGDASTADSGTGYGTSTGDSTAASAGATAPGDGAGYGASNGDDSAAVGGAVE